MRTGGRESRALPRRGGCRSVLSLGGSARTTTMKTSIIFAAVFFSGLFCRAENAVILKQIDAPLVITNHTATWKPNPNAPNSSVILHETHVKNVSGKEIVAFQMGFVLLDAFNSFMGARSDRALTDIRKGEDWSGFFEQSPYEAFRFARYGTAIVYVRDVRFADGSIWHVDMATIFLELKKLVKDLTREDLQEKRG
jgi:hypothetical protein